MSIESYKFMQKYEKWPKWRKFMHAYIFSIKSGGVTAIYKYPINYYKLKRMLRGKK